MHALYKCQITESRAIAARHLIAEKVCKTTWSIPVHPKRVLDECRGMTLSSYNGPVERMSED